MLQSKHTLPPKATGKYNFLKAVDIGTDVPIAVPTFCKRQTEPAPQEHSRRRPTEPRGESWLSLLNLLNLTNSQHELSRQTRRPLPATAHTSLPCIPFSRSVVGRRAPPTGPRARPRSSTAQCDLNAPFFASAGGPRPRGAHVRGAGRPARERERTAASHVPGLDPLRRRKGAPRRVTMAAESDPLHNLFIAYVNLGEWGPVSLMRVVLGDAEQNR